MAHVGAPGSGVVPDDGIARDSEYVCPLGTFVLDTPDVLIVQEQATQQILYGLAYLEAVYGIMVELVATRDPTGAVTSWSAVLHLPTAWGTHLTTYGPFAAFPGTITSLIRIDAQTLSRTAACDWTHGFPELRWYINGVLVYTTPGAVSESGSGYDRRLNCMPLTPSVASLPLSVPGGIPVCTAGDAPSISDEGVATIGPAGWRSWDGVGWQYDTIAVDNTYAPPDLGGACAVCVVATESIDSDVNHDSWNIILQAHWKYTWEKPVIASGHSDCDGGDGGPFDWTQWQVNEEFWMWDASIVAVPNSWGLLATQRHSYAICNGATTTPGDTVVTETLTYSEIFNTVLHTKGYNQCTSAIPVGCPPPVVNHSDFCSYTGFVRIFHPNLPPCGTARALAYDVSKYLRHARLRDDAGTGTIWMGVSHNALPAVWADVDTGITADQARIRFQDLGASSPIGILYPDGSGNLLFAQTPDEGKTFGSPMTVSAALAAGGFSDYDEGANGIRYFYWQQGGAAPYTIYHAVYDKDLNLIRGPVTTNITTSDLAPIAVRESYVQGSWRMGIEFTASGSVLWMQADDGVNFS